ncbi:DNA double-strand break repair nuclease NurA [Candidatus Nitrosocosmicus hydrocola]|uniref:DNA double-strand break repair nuclease NurA n=1 Tax=Candidatus Nitrosocosmicus hydrocola TaxID=1826872 RepID=UPI0011E5E980|nr:DNA double-strand break repair nuclease NurA [Candidatus Nitrosocosmicus hydrocola]
MLPDLFLDAIRNKETKISSLHGDGFKELLNIASNKWTDFRPIGKTAFTIGVDSSWNKKAFQGIDFFVIDCIAIDSHNDVSRSKSKWDYGIGNIAGDSLGSRAMLMEINVTKLVLDQKPDIICVDGSIVSNLVHNTNSTYLHNVRSLFEDVGETRILFISKNSTSTNQFKKFGSKAADIYYYNKLGLEPGFSQASINTHISKTLEVTEIYARLSSYVPLIKIEIINGAKVSESEIQSLLNKLYFHSIKGYPYCLKLAHQTCKITNNDVNRLANLYGFKNEFGSRDSLNE